MIATIAAFFDNKRMQVVIYAVLAIFFLSLSVQLPISININSNHDSAWFIRKGMSISSGEWFGEYNNMTLIKGPTYPLFLALNNFVGFPVSLSTALLHLAACTCWVWTLTRVGLPRTLALALFLLLLFQPAGFPTQALRDNIYPALGLFALSGWTLLTLDPDREKFWLPIGLTGLAMGFFWLTREEGVWVLPGFALLGAYAIANNWRSSRGVLVLAAFYIAMAMLPNIAIGLVNYSFYGAFQTVETNSKAFENALRDLSSVQAGVAVRRVPVTKSQREAIYAISPSFKQLQPQLEGALLTKWQAPGCGYYSNTCGDYAAGWFLWALRAAVSGIGKYSDPTTSQRFYEEISHDTQVACGDGRLVCQRNIVPFMPALTREAIADIPGGVVGAILMTVYRGETAVSDKSSVGTPVVLASASEFLGRPRIFPANPDKVTYLRGWFYGPLDNWPVLMCVQNTKLVQIEFARLPSPDLVKYFKDIEADNRRFSVEASHRDCRIRFGSDVANEFTVAELLARSNERRTIGDGIFRLNEAITFDNEIFGKGALELKSKILEVYRYLSPALLASGFFAFLALLVFAATGRMKFNAMLALALAVWTLYASRIAIIVLVDVTSFPAIDVTYLMPAFTLLPTAAVLSIALVMQQISPAAARPSRSLK